MAFDIAFTDLRHEQHIGNTPQLEVPVLARLAREIADRPLGAIEQPLEVDIETYTEARKEMVGIQRRRGFPLASANIRRENFLLRGVPIVPVINHG